MGGNKRKKDHGSTDDDREHIRSRFNAEKVKGLHAKLRVECAEDGGGGDAMAAWVRHTEDAEGLAEYAKGGQFKCIERVCC